MSPNMEMQAPAVGAGKALGRMFSGARMFQNIYTARGGSGHVLLQTMPVRNFAGAIASMLPSN